MPFFSGNRFFPPLVLLISIFLIWKGGARGRICVLMLILVVALGDPLVCNTIKHAIHRPRPFLTLPDVHVPDGVGRTDSGSMPSAHAANWFAAAMVAFIYYRRSWRFMLPLALLVSFSRVYNGVHYPSDVLAGAILGSGYGACLVWTLDRLWQCAGRRWFPLWQRRLPSLMNPVFVPAPQNEITDPKLTDQHWVRLAYLLIFVLFFGNLAFIKSGLITLSEDEAYQWIWSKHLALSYYSKPPLIALTQYAGTHLWGDNAFGVRFFAPVIALVSALALFPFMRRLSNPRAAFWLTVLLPAIPLVSLGSALMTIDPLSVMFWTFAMIAGWGAVQENSTWWNWFLVGLWMGLGFLSKYTALFQLLSWAAFFALWPPARKQLRRPGPYLALLVNVACSIPVLIWNHQHGWVTIQHVATNGHFGGQWTFTLANLWYGFKRYTSEFFLDESLLQNPFIFLPVIWAAITFWRRSRNNPLMLYFFNMGAPLFVVYLLLTFHSRVLPNWIAPSIVPLLCLGVIYWDQSWREGFRPLIKFLLASALIYGVLANVLLRDTRVILKLTGFEVPARLDSTRRVKGWPEVAQAIDAVRQKLMAEDGKPVFIIGSNYGITGEVTFYLPEASMAVSDHPFVYFLAHTDKPQNQFFFWPNYLDRKGQNAIFVNEIDIMDTNPRTNLTFLQQEFDTVTNATPLLVMSQGKPAHRIQIAICRDLK